MDLLFRLPKFPVLLDTGELLVYAKNRAQLESKLSKITLTDNTKRDLIDARAEGVSLYPEKMLIAPNISSRKWTKVKIIELYNSKRKPGATELRTTSLGNRSLGQIVGEIVALLSQG